MRSSKPKQNTERLHLYQTRRATFREAGCHAFITAFMLALPINLFLFPLQLFGSIAFETVLSIIFMFYIIKIIVMLWFWETTFRNGGILIDFLNELLIFYEPGSGDDYITTVQINVLCKNIAIALIPWKWQFIDFENKLTVICKINEFENLQIESTNEDSQIIIIHNKGKYVSPNAPIVSDRAEMTRKRLQTLSAKYKEEKTKEEVNQLL